MARAGFRIGVVGATGALGTEVLEMLGVSSLPVREIVPVATDDSLGSDIEFQGEEYPVEIDDSRFVGLDLILLCAPPAVSLDFVRRALEEKTPCIDLSGATSGSEDVPLRIAGYGSLPKAAPLIAVPTSPTLPLLMALLPLANAAGLQRVSATVLEAASAAGKDGVASLYQESLAVFNQQTPPAPTVFPGPVAFDCLSGAGELEADGSGPKEVELIRNLGSQLGSHVGLTATVIQVPIFVGLGLALSIETQRDLAPSEAADCLGKAPGVEVWPDGQPGPTTRAAAGRDRVIAGRLRGDASAPRALQLWLAADPLRLAASHAIQLAALRLG
jgi:aspartate-semialdehyde dehydrogenase